MTAAPFGVLTVAPGGGTPLPFRLLEMTAAPYGVLTLAPGGGTPLPSRCSPVVGSLYGGGQIDYKSSISYWDISISNAPAPHKPNMPSGYLDP